MHISLSLTCRGFKTSTYGALLLFVLPSVRITKTFAASALSPSAALKIWSAAILRARSVLVPPPVYFRPLMASCSLERLWYSDFARLNCNVATELKTMAPTWVPCGDTDKWPTRSERNFKALAKFPLPTLPEASIIRPTSSDFLQAV